MLDQDEKSNLKQGVVAGILASIIVFIFIQPILTWIWGLVSESSSRFWVEMVDNVYSNASFGQRSLAATLVLGLLSGVLINGVMFITIFRPFLVPWLGGRLIKKFGFGQEKLKRTVYLIRVGNIAVGLMLIGSILSLLLLVFTDLQLNSSFDRRLAALAPAISDQDYKEFRSLWARMKNRADYLQLNNKMEEMAKMRNVVLPRSLVD